MDEKFLDDAFNFHQTLYKDLKDRNWDACCVDMIKLKMEFAFKICYGTEWSPMVEKITSKIRTTFFEVSHEDTEGLRTFNCIFLYNRLNKNGRHWISVLFKTTGLNGNEIFIDEDCRIYKTFNDFLQKCKYPKCFMTFPDAGVYKGKCFAVINCAWSKSCGTKQLVLDVLDVTSVAGSVVATGFLLTNPIGITFLAAQVGFISTSLYGIGRGLDRLIDAVDHEGGFMSESALLASIEIALTTGGMLTLSASQALKALSRTQANVILEGALSYRIAIALEKCFKVLCMTGAGIYFILFIKKFRNNTLTRRDLLDLSKYLLFSFNCYVSIDLLKMLLSDLAGFVSEVCGIEYLLKRKDDIYVVIKKVNKFICSEDYANLLTELFPYRETKLYKELAPIRKGIGEITNCINDYMANRNNPLLFTSTMVNSTRNLYQNIVFSLNRQENEVSKIFNSDDWKPLCKWTEENKNKGVCNTYTKKIEMLNTLKKTTLDCTFHIKDENNQKQFFEFLLSLIKQQKIEDNSDAVKKIKFYTKVFTTELLEIMKESPLKTFKENGNTVYKTNIVACPGKVTEEADSLKSCYDQVMNKMTENLDLYKQKFIEHEETDTNEVDTMRFVYFFNRKVTGEIRPEIYLDIANSLANLSVNHDNSIFCSFQNNVSSIRMTQDENMLIFIAEREESVLKGVMINIPLQESHPYFPL